jgi:2-methylcitrate dehydratase
MITKNTPAQPSDRLLEALARFAVHADVTLTPATGTAGLSALIDSMGVALGALQHPSAVIARRYAEQNRSAEGATLWGSNVRVNVEAAALANGVPLRAYDFNDLYIGRTGGHPSDLIPGLIAVAQSRQKSGPEFFEAMVLGYEVAIVLLDCLELDSAGWDYPNITAIAAACAIARITKLTEEQTRHALAITVIPHLASDEVESGDLNARGDLTMWKRFNGADAIRHAIYSCTLAEAGAEGAVRPFEGNHGFLSKLTADRQDLDTLYSSLETMAFRQRILDVTFKRWPVGSRAQSAIQAALEAAAQVADVSTIKKVEIICDEQAFEHLVLKRVDPWNPISRETADHSLPYIVGAAVLEGKVDISTFDVEKVLREDRQSFVRDKVTAISDRALNNEKASAFLCRVIITDASGSTFTGEPKAPPGHRSNPFDQKTVEGKFMECAAPSLGWEHARDTLTWLQRAKSCSDMSSLGSILDSTRFQ